ncbi:MAG: hypothetical protein E7160_03915 [Firmicutes bacterium]|nr:hypothetical protein [Bacillota bacterium]
MNKVKKIIIDYRVNIITFLIPFIILCVIFLGYYPGILSYDSLNQLGQVESGMITNSHPFFSTYFIYLLFKIHASSTTVLLFQIFIFSSFWSYFCGLFKDKIKCNLIIYSFTFVMSLFPVISIYSITLWKDILYSYYLFMIGVLLFKGINNKFNYKNYEYIIIGLLLTLISNYRHNGLYVVVMYFILLIIVIISKRKVINKDIMKKIGLLILAFVLLNGLISIPKKIYLSRYDKYKAKITTKEEKEKSLSLKNNYIIWMMSAHLRDGNITDEEDLEFLNDILEVKKWKEVYDPYIINSITMCKDFDGKFVNNNDSKLMSIFLKYSIKHPFTIVKHYLKSDALLIDPISQFNGGSVYVFAFSEWGYLGFDGITTPKIKFIQDQYDKVINFGFVKPLKIFYQPALILYLSIIMLIILSIKVYDRRIWLFGTPMFFNTISLLPINLAQDLRYAYINYLVFFAVLLLFILNFDKIFNKPRKKA